MDPLTYFKETAATLKNPDIETWKKSGHGVIGLTCSNIPEEVLYAAGLLPLRLRAPGLIESGMADAHLHRINCTYTRAVLEFLLRGEYDFLNGMVTTNTCDHHLRLAGELGDKHHMSFIHYFQMYHSLTDGAREWFIMEMRKLIGNIERTFEIEISEKDFKRVFSVYNRTRGLMSRLNELRKTDPPALSGSEYMQVVLTGMSTPREPFNDHLETLLTRIEGRQSGEAGMPRLLIMGGGFDSPAFIEFIESKGASIVADGLCFGLRHYQGLIDEQYADPLEALADRYLRRVPCPSIIDGFDQGYGELKKMMHDWDVQGVICARLKFCDHWAGERKMLKDAMQRDKGVPLLDLEREYSTTGSGQISTRVQAFLEMLPRH
jgi:benzoyl-CoA reductase/2-hydroxyglutaryl-CoA dehydratase subunit BcrC/BadD/HgdB